jgi:hypothetical protein
LWSSKNGKTNEHTRELCPFSKLLKLLSEWFSSEFVKVLHFQFSLLRTNSQPKQLPCHRSYHKSTDSYHDLKPRCPICCTSQACELVCNRFSPCTTRRILPNSSCLLRVAKLANRLSTSISCTTSGVCHYPILNFLSTIPDFNHESEILCTWLHDGMQAAQVFVWLNHLVRWNLKFFTMLKTSRWYALIG